MLSGGLHHTYRLYIKLGTKGKFEVEIWLVLSLFRVPETISSWRQPHFRDAPDFKHSSLSAQKRQRHASPWSVGRRTQGVMMDFTPQLGASNLAYELLMMSRDPVRARGRNTRVWHVSASLRPVIRACRPWPPPASGLQTARNSRDS